MRLRSDNDGPRHCGIAARLGHRVACPHGGCALLHALGESLPADPRSTCPVDAMLAAGENELVLRTLDELRREMERGAFHGLDPSAASVRADRHAAVLRRWA